MSSPPVVVIPAYKPGQVLVFLVAELSASGFRIVVVDDGSGPDCAAIFDALRPLKGVTVQRHALNLGKGAALRTGINQALVLFSDTLGVITADADGQHLVDDIVAVARQLENNPESLVMGVRGFATGVPFRSRFGNIVSRSLTKLVLGHSLQDTQTGLRGIPAWFARELLSVNSNGYEFELDMLIAAKHKRVSLIQVPIQTVYIDNNRSSHFRPLRDSMKIGFVLLRFSLLSLATSLLDNMAFAAAYMIGGQIVTAQISARVIAMCFNYTLGRRAVFLSREPHFHTLPRYLLLVVMNGVASYALLSLLHTAFGVSVFFAKIAAELVLFVASFAIQRDFVFTRRQALATDWDAYYKVVFPAAHLTRRYTGNVLNKLLRKFTRGRSELTVLEFGGANSCFAETLSSRFPITRYAAVDLNEYGLKLLAERQSPTSRVSAIRGDVLDGSSELAESNVVMSIGLIEHFDAAGTRAAIANHFRVCSNGGLVILSYPTPTLLYSIARFLAELCGMWKFHDERPLQRDEVLMTASRYGSLFHEELLWPLIFTQRVMVFRKEVAC